MSKGAGPFTLGVSAGAGSGKKGKAMVAERGAIEGLLRRLWGGWALKRGATALGCGLLLLTMPRAQAASELGTPGALLRWPYPWWIRGRGRALAERSALEILLKRLSPAPGLTSRPSIALALRDPDQYYRSASYAPGGALSPGCSPCSLIGKPFFPC